MFNSSYVPPPYLHSNTHTHIHTLALIHTHTHIHSHTFTHIQSHTHTLTHLHTHIHSHTHTLTHLHTHIHTHTHTLQVFGFYEEFLSSRFPYSSYKLVFVNQLCHALSSYSTLGVFDTNLLHSARVIDQVMITRKVIGLAVAKQYFGCYALPQSWCVIKILFRIPPSPHTHTHTHTQALYNYVCYNVDVNRLK